MSFWPPSNRVGIRTLATLTVPGAPGASPIAAFNDGRGAAASRAPPPPIECPITASRLASTRLRTELFWVR